MFENLERTDNIVGTPPYHSVLSNVFKIKEIFLKTIENTEGILQKSNEEELCAISLDFFSYQ